jgi:hypothetical protein
MDACPDGFIPACRAHRAGRAQVRDSSRDDLELVFAGFVGMALVSSRTRRKRN